MLRTIDADALYKNEDERKAMELWSLYKIARKSGKMVPMLSGYRLIKEEPLVRCKDCKYMIEHYDTDGNAPYWTCSEWDSATDYDGFCHHAERREHYGKVDKNS